MANNIIIPSMVEYQTYKEIMNSNISYREFMKEKEHLENIAEKKEKEKQQLILDKINKNIALTPEEYEYKVKWDNRLKPAPSKSYSSTNSSSSDMWMWFIWGAIIWSLLD